jgi:hypothetical protein
VEPCLPIPPAGLRGCPGRREVQPAIFVGIGTVAMGPGHSRSGDAHERWRHEHWRHREQRPVFAIGWVEFVLNRWEAHVWNWVGLSLF